MKTRLVIGSLALLFFVGGPSFAQGHQSDAQIRRDIIRYSIVSYPGNCPCPYNTARNGSLCGRRSAYNRPGGYAPICYDRDVTPEMIRDYRARHGK